MKFTSIERIDGDMDYMTARLNSLKRARPSTALISELIDLADTMLDQLQAEGRAYYAKHTGAKK